MTSEPVEPEPIETPDTEPTTGEQAVNPTVTTEQPAEPVPYSDATNSEPASGESSEETVPPESPATPEVSVEHKFRTVWQQHFNNSPTPAYTYTSAEHDTEEFITWAKLHKKELSPLARLLATLL